MASLAPLALLGLMRPISFPAAGRTAAPARLKVVVVIFDGLRPDYITGARMPALHAFGQRGVVSSAHHSLFPTVTRVNGSSLVTGASPGRHGILDNVIYLPGVDAERALNTGDGETMMRADSVLGGSLLSVPTLPALLRAREKRMVVASAGSSGSAYLLAGAGQATTLNAELTLPGSLEAMTRAVLGAPPADASPNLGLNARAVDALLRIGVDSLDTDVAFLWFSDPDHTAHAAGIGSALADSSIRAADREFGRLLDGLRVRGLGDAVDVFVVSDHGFSTHAGRDAPITSVLAEFKGRVMIAGGAVYVRRGGDTTRAEVVRALQGAPSVGAIFTRARVPGGVDGRGVESGTLSFESIGWDHARAGDVLFSANWSHGRNPAGFAGQTGQAGVAGHGTTSPHDISATLVAAGPHIRVGIRSAIPSSNADIAPTLLHLLGIVPPRSMTGRALRELMLAGPEPGSVRVQRDSLVAHTSVPTHDGMEYRTTLYRSRVGDTRYVDSTRTLRTTRARAPGLQKR